MEMSVYSHKAKSKIISVTEGTKVKQYNITSVLPIAPETKDPDLKHDMDSLTHNYKDTATPEAIWNVLLT